MFVIEKKKRRENYNAIIVIVIKRKLNLFSLHYQLLQTYVKQDFKDKRAYQAANFRNYIPGNQFEAGCFFNHIQS